MTSASSMASAAEYRRLLKGLDSQSRQSRQPVRRTARAKAVYPGKNRTRSLEPLGSIDEIVMESDFSDSAVSPPPSNRQRRPSTPMNFSRPDPANFSPRLSREPSESQPPEKNGQVRLPVRSVKTKDVHRGSQSDTALPDEPSFDESDDEEYFISRTQPRPQTHANEQRYIRRPGSAGTGAARPSTSEGPRIPARTIPASATRENSSSKSRASSHQDNSSATHKRGPSLSYSAVNMTAPLPQLTRNYTSTSTQTIEDRERTQQDRQTRKIMRRLPADSQGEQGTNPHSEVPASDSHKATIDGHLTANSSSSNSAQGSKESMSISRASTREGGASSRRRPERNRAPPSQHSSEDTNLDEEKPPCWAGSDFDPRSVLTDKEISKLKKKGINPALYAEMQAAKKSGRESGGGKGRKWIGPLVGNGYTG